MRGMGQGCRLRSQCRLRFGNAQQMLALLPLLGRKELKDNQKKDRRKNNEKKNQKRTILLDFFTIFLQIEKQQKQLKNKADNAENRVKE